MTGFDIIGHNKSSITKSYPSRRVRQIAKSIQLAGLTVTFIKSRHETGGAFDAFEMTISTTAHVVVAHLHRHYDETVFGVDGVSTWTVEGRVIEVGPGDQLFIPRGSRHTYVNLGPAMARVLCLITPGALGPEYFQEIACVMEEEGPIDFAAVGAIMNRYGIIPASVMEPLTPSGMPAPGQDRLSSVRTTPQLDC